MRLQIPHVNIKVRQYEWVKIDDCITYYCDGQQTSGKAYCIQNISSNSLDKFLVYIYLLSTGSPANLATTCGEIRGHIIRTGERVQVDDCHICFCRGSEIRCDIQSCSPTSCQNPVKFYGECCETCKYFMTSDLRGDNWIL